jgi:pimeloyl-ACP methyl ester carboxylesterase
MVKFAFSSKRPVMKHSITLILFIITLISCQKEIPEEVSFEFDIMPEGESNVVIGWDDIEPGNTIKFSVDTDDQFTDPLVTTEANASEGTVTLTGLAPVTRYFLKIEVSDNQVMIWSGTEEFTSKYSREVVWYASTDNVTLCANLDYISSALSPSSKTVIFMHEFSRSKTSWYVTGIVDTLVKDGNLCVAIDFRGHGASSYDGDMGNLIDQPRMLKEDFDATIQMLDTIHLEHSSEVIVFGASMGACVATSTSTYSDVLGGVAASAVAKISRSMWGSGTFAPAGIFYIAGELDKNAALNIDYEKDANSLSSITKEPSMVKIVEDSYDHGVRLLEVDPDLIAEAIEWVRDL